MVLFIFIALNNIPVLEAQDTSSPEIDAGEPVVTKYKYDETNVTIIFDDSKIIRVGDDTKIVRMEWDYNGDEKPDWSYVPSDCDLGETCPVPSTVYDYDTPGYTMARFCVIDDLGRKTCDSKRINVMKERPPDDNDTFVESIIIDVIIIALLIGLAWTIYITTIAKNKKRKG